ncbi:MAG: D-alanine--D-alanine ligase family protein [Luteolibacter sp.]
MSLDILKSIKIAVIMGGPGHEREVSLASGKAVHRTLQDLGLNAIAVDVKTADLLELPVDTGLVFNLIHGTFGEDGQVQRILEERGIPFTGAGSDSSRQAFDKCLAKAALTAAAVPTPRYKILDADCDAQQLAFDLPMVIKPPCEGSSVGVHIVRDSIQLPAALTDVASYGSKILVEEFIEGLELTVAILDQQAALAAHQALGIEIYSRVDVLLDRNGNPQVLEANTIPGMTETSLLPKAAAAAGISFSELCVRIATQSLSCHRRSPKSTSAF